MRAEHAPHNAMTAPGEIAYFYDRCSDLMRALLDELAAAPGRPRTFPEIEDALGWPRRRIASVLGGAGRFRVTECGGRRPYHFHDERQAASGRWELWMDAGQARAVRAARSASRGPDRLAEFGSPGPMRDRLVDAVLRGAKTATSSLLSDWAEEGEPLPAPGERQAVVDSAGRLVATIEVVAVDVIRLGDADAALARDEGEGFRSVAEWRAAHEDFWLGEDRDGAGLPDETEIVVERFRLARSASPSGA